VTIKVRRDKSSAWKPYTYTRKMAEDAGLVNKRNWKSFGVYMMIWRCIGMIARTEGADMVSGLYPVEEINPELDVDADGTPMLTYTAPQDAENEDGTGGGETLTQEEKLAGLLRSIREATGTDDLTLADAAAMLQITDHTDMAQWREHGNTIGEIATAVARASEANDETPFELGELQFVQPPKLKGNVRYIPASVKLYRTSEVVPATIWSITTFEDAGYKVRSVWENATEVTSLEPPIEVTVKKVNGHWSVSEVSPPIESGDIPF